MTRPTTRRLAEPLLYTVPSTGSAQPNVIPSNTYCLACDDWNVIERHCKLTCLTCGATRDCSDP